MPDSEAWSTDMFFLVLYLHGRYVPFHVGLGPHFVTGSFISIFKRSLKSDTIWERSKWIWFQLRIVQLSAHRYKMCCLFSDVCFTFNCSIVYKSIFKKQTVHGTNLGECRPCIQIKDTLRRNIFTWQRKRQYFRKMYLRDRVIININTTMQSLYYELQHHIRLSNTPQKTDRTLSRMAVANLTVVS